MNCVMVDVESDGSITGDYSMISFGPVLVTRAGGPLPRAGRPMHTNQRVPYIGAHALRLWIDCSRATAAFTAGISPGSRCWIRRPNGWGFKHDTTHCDV